MHAYGEVRQHIRSLDLPQATGEMKAILSKQCRRKTQRPH
jgi:hypothetical protein